MADDTTLTFYNENSSSVAARYESADLPSLQRLIRTHLAPEASVLEIGSGSGRDAAFMVGAGFKVTGLDGSEKMIEEAVVYHPELAGLLQHHVLPAPLPFPEGSFDSVYAAAVLMHFEPDVIRLISGEIYRVLKEDGMFLFSVPVSHDAPTVGTREGDTRRFTLLDSDSWVRLLRDSGFSVLEQGTVPDGLGRADILWMIFACRKSTADTSAAER